MDFSIFRRLTAPSFLAFLALHSSATLSTTVCNIVQSPKSHPVENGESPYTYSKVCTSVAPTETTPPTVGQRPPPPTPISEWAYSSFLNQLAREAPASFLPSNISIPSSHTEVSEQQSPREETMTDCPVLLSTGLKYYEEIDYIGTGELPLTIIRSHISKTYPLRSDMMAYDSWTIDHLDALQIKYTDGTYCSQTGNYQHSTSSALIAQCDNLGVKTIEKLTLSSKGHTEDFANTGNDYFKKAGDFSFRYIRAKKSSGKITNFEYATGDNTYTFSKYGLLEKKQNLNGVSLTYTYKANGLLDKVTHSSGRSLTFNWERSTQNHQGISSITLPNGKSIQYSGSLDHNGMTTTYPDNLGIKKYISKAGDSGISSIWIDNVQWGDYGYNIQVQKVAHSGIIGGVNRSTFQYTADKTTVTNAKNGEAIYYYDDKKRLTGISRSESSTCPMAASNIAYADDTSSKIKHREDWKGNRTAYLYYASGNLNQEYANGITKEYFWDVYGRLSKINIWDGAKTPSMCKPGASCPTPRSTPTLVEEFIYDPSIQYKNRLKQKTSKALKYNSLAYTDERITHFSYEFHGNSLVQKLKYWDSSLGESSAITLEFNAKGDMTNINYPNGGQETYTHKTDNSGLVETHEDRNGFVSEFNYDALSRLTSSIQNYGHGNKQTSFQYYTDGQIKRIDYPNGNWEQFYLDSARRISWISRPDEVYMYNRTSFSYDLLSNLEKQREQYLVEQMCTGYTYTNGRITGSYAYRCDSYQDSLISMDASYDQQGYLHKANGQSNQQTTYKYDANGNIEEATDANGLVTKYTYNSANQIKTITNPMNQTVTYSYDSMGHIASITDARNQTTHYRRNGFGEIEKVESPDTGTTDYDYYENGSAKYKLNALGIRENYYYDTYGRLNSVQTTGHAKNQTINYFYDTSAPGSGITCQYASGNLCGYTDASGATNFSYTKHGAISAKQQIISGTSYITTNSFDALGRIDEVTYPNGIKLKYGYDYDDNVKSISAYFNGSWKNVVERKTYVYYEQLTYGNGIIAKELFDKDGRTTEITSDVQGLTFLYKNKANEVEKITNSKISTATQTYSYDNAGRLKTITSGFGNQTFNYDANGNRTSHIWGGATDTYGAATGANKIPSISSTASRAKTITHNAVGNITNVATAEGPWIYNYDAFGRLAEKTGAGGSPTTYLYNAANQRTSKKTMAPFATHFLYDTQGNLVIEATQYPTGYPNGAALSGINSIYIYLGNRVVGLVRNNQLYFVHNDHLGATEVVTSSNKAVVWRASYNGFSRYHTTSTASFGGLYIGFPGQYYDAESGLWYNWNRYYDSRTGRYIQADPLGLFDGTNLYAYAYNNPVSYTDPTGQFVPMMLVGMLLGAGMEYLTNPCATAGSIAAAGALGAIGGGVGGLVGSAGKSAFRVTSSKSFSKFEDATKPGSKLPNIKTDVNKHNFEKNLQSNGFSKSTSKDGNVNIFVNGDKKYSTREFSKSTGGPTAEVFINNQPISKIRLGDL